MEKFGVFFNFMNAGGAINWVILSLYLVILAVFSHRAVYFCRTRCRRQFLFAVLESGGSAAALEQLRPSEKQSPLYRIAEKFSHNAEKPEAVLMEIVDRKAALLKKEMENGLTVLSFIGTIAPLLGLLGTITGLMNAFAQIETRGASVDISFLSGGIREAMITTATGLVTAICALGCCKLFEHLSSSRLQEMSLAISLLTEKHREARV
ncbi:hypothetical protein AGMMS50293_24880 [Spirochaetia bacterium]|nr:hypothetical protein AGMMS50293_24880 [Spirochaetia bacterium]